MSRLARRRPSPPTGYSSLFHISRGRSPPPRKLRPFLSRLRAVPLTSVGEKKSLENTGKYCPPAGLPFFPLESHTCVWPHCWQKTSDVSGGWKKIRGKSRPPSGQWFALFFFSPTTDSRFFLGKRQHGPTTSWVTLKKFFHGWARMLGVKGWHCGTVNPLWYRILDWRWNDERLCLVYFLIQILVNAFHRVKRI